MAWLVILYGAFWFGASHPLILGVNAEAVQGLPGFVGTFVVGALVYRRTCSLRWPIFGHTLQDLFAPPILVFLNLAVIAG
jgi:hypothetical protein